MDPNDRRAHCRVSIAVEVDFTSGCNFYSAQIRDISAGGLFIETDVSLPIGAHVLVDLKFLKQHLRVDSEVMWVLSDGGSPVGVGVQFLDLRPSARKSIEAFMVLRHPLSCGAAEEEPSPRATPPALPPA